MADGRIRRFVTVVWDRIAGKKVETEFERSLASAGEKSGKAFLREMRAAFDKRMGELKVQLAKGLIDQKEFKKQADLAARQFNAGILKGMEDARKAGKLTDSEYLKLSRTLKRVGDDGATAGARLKAAFLGGAIGTAVVLGLRRFQAFLADSIHEAIAAEDAIGRLDVALRTVGRTYQGTSDELERYVTQLTHTTRFTDDDARLALANLITATGSYEKSLGLLNVTAQIAEKRNITMAQAAQTAADASNGLTRGMKDLGISTNETGNIVEKIERNLGKLAEQGLDKPGRKLQQINKLWDDFKEKIGLAILASNGLQGSLGDRGLLGILVSLNDWAEKNSSAISSLVDNFLGLVRAGQEVGKFFLKFIPNLVMISKLVDRIRGKQGNLFGDVTVGGSSTADAPGGGGGDRGGDPTERQKALAAELERIETDTAVARLQIQTNLTESEAREQVRREQLLAGHVARQVATLDQLKAAYAALDAAQKALTNRALADQLQLNALMPGVKRGTFATPGLQGAPTSFPKFGEDAASQAKIKAAQFASPWIDALELIHNEVEGEGTLFRQLGEAWAEGGIAGFAKLASMKVRENLARAIEEGAKAFGSLFTNPAEATAHALAAAKHGVAAVAWKAVGGVGGALAGGGASSSGGVSAGAPNIARSANAQPAPAEVHIYIDPLNPSDPRAQQFVHRAAENARERYGQNAKIIMHPGSP